MRVVADENTEILTKRLRTAVWVGIALMTLFSIISIVQYILEPILFNLASVFLDPLMLFLLIAIQIFIKRIDMSISAIILSFAIMAYSTLNIVFYPDLVLRFICDPFLAILVAVAYVKSSSLRLLSIAGWISMMLTVWLSNRSVGMYHAPDIIDYVAMSATVAIGLLPLYQFHQRVLELLRQSNQSNALLRISQATLEHQVNERTLSLQQALAEIQLRANEQEQLLKELDQQRVTIQNMSVPILPIGESTLAIPLVGAFDTERLTILETLALQATANNGIRRVVIDITGVVVVDSAVAAGLIQVVRSLRLLGAEAILTGIRPEVAQTMVGLGVDMHELRTKATLQEGMHLALNA